MPTEVLYPECCIAFDDPLHDLEQECNKGSQFDVLPSQDLSFRLSIPNPFLPRKITNPRKVYSRMARPETKRQSQSSEKIFSCTQNWI